MICPCSFSTLTYCSRLKLTKLVYNYQISISFIRLGNWATLEPFSKCINCGLSTIVLSKQNKSTWYLQHYNKQQSTGNAFDLVFFARNPLRQVSGRSMAATSLTNHTVYNSMGVAVKQDDVITSNRQPLVYPAILLQFPI